VKWNKNKENSTSVDSVHGRRGCLWHPRACVVVSQSFNHGADGSRHHPQRWGCADCRQTPLTWRIRINEVDLFYGCWVNNVNQLERCAAETADNTWEVPPTPSYCIQLFYSIFMLCRGRQRKRWMDNVREDLEESGIQLSTAYGKSKNREVWRNTRKVSSSASWRKRRQKKGHALNDFAKKVSPHCEVDISRQQFVLMSGFEHSIF